MRRLVVVLGVVMFFPAFAPAQELERVTFEDAVRRAVSSHPTVRQAAAGVLRAQAVLQQSQARTRPSLDASLSRVTSTLLAIGSAGLGSSSLRLSLRALR